MNWTETITGAVTVFIAGMMMTRDYTMKFVVGVGEIFVPDNATELAELITIGGIAVTPVDLIITLILTATCSLIASTASFKNPKAAALNWLLGFLFGILFAQIAIVVLHLPPVTIFGLAPSLALIAAKVAKSAITDDNVVNVIFSALGRFLGSRNGNGNGKNGKKNP